MKQRHLTPEQLAVKYKVRAIVDQELKEARAELCMNEQVERAISATHVADMMIDLTILFDHFGADKEWLQEFLDLRLELLGQYNDEVITKDQMLNHLKLRAGIDVEEYNKRFMVFTGIDSEARKQKEGVQNDTERIS